MANSKTPYELRFDMYNVAMDRLQQNYFATNDEIREGSEKVPLNFPTAEMAIAEARTIDNFVSNNHY